MSWMQSGAGIYAPTGSGVGPGGGGSGGGGSCPANTQALPPVTGQLLLGAGCSVCCPKPDPTLMGTQSPCDPPHPDNCWGTANTLSHTGGAGVGGSTPVTLNYTVDLTFLGAYGVATVLEARSTYVVDAGGSATITDNGGSAAVGSAPVTIEWDPWKIDLWLNSATGKNAPIQAVGTFPFGGGHFHVVEFWIMYKVCPDPRRSP